MTPEEYRKLVDETYDLIVTEIEYFKNPERENDLPIVYPKLVIMYEYFRLLRGEAFLDAGKRPSAPEYQHDFYSKENDIRAKLEELKEKLNPDDERTKDNLQRAKDKFEL